MVQWNLPEIEGAIVGGILISLASTLNFFLYGRSEGMHLLFANAIHSKREPSFLWKISFIFGVATLPFLALRGIFDTGDPTQIEIFGQEFKVFDQNIRTIVNLSAFVWIISGFLVGMGTKMTVGLAGGHVYCSAPVYKSKGNIAAVVSLITGFLVATLRQHFPFLKNQEDFQPSSWYQTFTHWLAILVFAVAATYTLYYMVLSLIREEGIESSESLVSFLIGILQGGGLLLSGALRPSIIVGFLTITCDHWNPTLLVLMVTVTLVNLAIYYLIVGKAQPFYDEDYQLLSDEELEQAEDPIEGSLFTKKLVIGSILFGAGWALSGICPGTLISGAFFAYSHSILFALGSVMGAFTYRVIDVLFLQNMKIGSLLDLEESYEEAIRVTIEQ